MSTYDYACYFCRDLSRRPSDRYMIPMNWELCWLPVDVVAVDAFAAAVEP